MTPQFDPDLNVAYGAAARLSPLVQRVLAPNPGPFTYKGTGVYLVGAGDSLAMIDPGPLIADHLSALKRAVGTRRLSHILITHSHRDHSPAAAPLKAWSGATIYGLPDHAGAFNSPLHPSHLIGAAGTSPASADARGGGPAEGAVDEAHDHDFVPDVMVHDGMRIAGEGFGFECVLTPGHTANHVCYALAGEKALFSGDHVMGWSTSVVAPPDGDMGQYIASLEKLLGRDDHIFYPTHGLPIPGPKARLQTLIGHRRMREEQILEALAQGDRNVDELTARIYPGIGAGLLRAAAQQVLAHLLYLAEKGQVRRDGAAWRLIR